MLVLVALCLPFAAAQIAQITTPFLSRLVLPPALITALYHSWHGSVIALPLFLSGATNPYHLLAIDPLSQWWFITKHTVQSATIKQEKYVPLSLVAFPHSVAHMQHTIQARVESITLWSHKQKTYTWTLCNNGLTSGTQRSLQSTILEFHSSGI